MFTSYVFFLFNVFKQGTRTVVLDGMKTLELENVTELVKRRCAGLTRCPPAMLLGGFSW